MQTGREKRRASPLYLALQAEIVIHTGTLQNGLHPLYSPYERHKRDGERGTIFTVGNDGNSILHHPYYCGGFRILGIFNLEINIIYIFSMKYKMEVQSMSQIYRFSGGKTRVFYELFKVFTGTVGKLTIQFDDGKNYNI